MYQSPNNLENVINDSHVSVDPVDPYFREPMVVDKLPEVPKCLNGSSAMISLNRRIKNV